MDLCLGEGSDGKEDPVLARGRLWWTLEPFAVRGVSTRLLGNRWVLSLRFPLPLVRGRSGNNLHWPGSLGHITKAQTDLTPFN